MLILIGWKIEVISASTEKQHCAAMYLTTVFNI